MLARAAAQLGLSVYSAGASTSAAAASSVGCLRCYHKNVVEHYEKPRNVGSFDKNDPNV